MGNQLSPHFNEDEFLCRHCGAGVGKIDPRLISLLEEVRRAFGRPIRIASGYRCIVHNSDVGGAPQSAHLTGEAADIFCVFAGDRFQILDALFNIGAHRVGIGASFIHVDVSRSLPPNVCWTYGGE